MKLLRRFLLIQIILFSLIAGRVSAAKNITYYGLIDKHPVTMTLHFSDNGNVTGSYFYNKDQKKISLKGSFRDNELDLQVWNETGELEARFIGYLKNPASNRIIGSWISETKQYYFELRTEGIPDGQIDPLEDNYLQYEEMKYWPDFVFNVPIDLGSGRYSPVKVDYYNDLPVENLKIIAEKNQK